MKLAKLFVKDRRMILHREYLNYPSNRYIVTFEGKGPRIAEQEMQIKIESVVRGKRCPPKIIHGKGTVNALRDSAKRAADGENPGANGRWQPFTCVIENGEYKGGTIALPAEVNNLLAECGEMTRHQLESGAEPEIVALCGGIESALAVLSHCEAGRARHARA